MPFHTLSLPLTAAVVLAAGSAMGQATTVTVDPAQSAIDTTIEVQTSFGNRSDNDSTTVSGSVTLELDAYGQLGAADAPTVITISGYTLVADNDLTFNFDYGFVGSITATAAGLGLSFPVGGTPAVGTVDPTTGAFSVLAVPNAAVGTIATSGSGLVGALLPAETIDLSTQPQGTIDIAGTISVAGGIVTATVNTVVQTTVAPVDGVSVVVDASADAVATGPVPEPACPCDVNNDTFCNGSDFFAWVNAFGSNAPECDVNNDTACNGSDFFAWVNAFGQGC